MTRNAIRFAWHDGDPTCRFRTGVSLHSHTMHSRERLTFIPRYARSVPLLSWEFKRLERRFEACKGRPMDFSAAYWTPPLTALEAFHVEHYQIQNGLGLSALVSLTDHDTVEAGSDCQAAGREVPISVEWTIPFGGTFFHLGVHNLPRETALRWMVDLSTYTRVPDPRVLRELLAALHAEAGVLIVLNHPMWDQADVGQAQHRAAFDDLIKSAGERIHAFEVNGLRSWNENRVVVDLARALSRSIISGGDRHGREPNANINLTNALTFTEFAGEVRSGCSHVLFCQQYREPLRVRILQTLIDVAADCPGSSEREHWMDRVFYAPRDGEFVPLSSVWKNGEPAVVRCFIRGIHLARSRGVQRIMRRWLIGQRCEERSTLWLPDV